MKTVTLQHDLIHVGNLILVNAQYPYRERIARNTLLSVNAENNEVMLDSNAARLLSSLIDKLNGWGQIAVVSGWRSVQEQKVIYNQSLKDNGKAFTEKFVALPGHSEHQTGLAIDLAMKQ